MELYRSKYSDKKKSGRNSKRDNMPSRSFRNFSNDKNSRYSRDNRNRESATVTCADCGTECEIPFVPKTDRPVYCSDCFRLNKPQNSGTDRYPRDDRGSRYSRDNRRREELKSKKSKNDKFLKKQESFYSNGSEKFYMSLKEKLFEILGGKVCYSCGFRDERALGISHIFDNGTFDSVRRGGSASSWGKYISEPDLAREELRVLCLNCNEIRQPISKPKQSGNSKPKPKKSRYFPR